MMRNQVHLLKQLKKMEVNQLSKCFCKFCGKYAVKRKVVGILQRLWQGESWRCLHFERCDREKYHLDAKGAD